MTWDTIAGAWKQVRGSIREQWGKLTDDDLDVVAGRRDQLVGLIQRKYGFAKEQVEREVDEFATRWKARFEQVR
ncbi:MAG: CsbD family protein [Gemmatimonadales bacterium]